VGTARSRADSLRVMVENYIEAERATFEIRATIAQALRIAREHDLKLSLREAAELVGTTATTLLMCERGKLSVQMAQKIVDAYAPIIARRRP
jgi:hypothetical protein